ncbi:unnamed protein product [Cuscuta epithymum]|uniref:CCHC-type domain-containing protein n=1 Tax=Cuscuta epithymum TaxID=186058 RepID=A0AAV0E4K0_9ASTE|nr:unnamed protein product [Cuscuta epithymum]
MKDKESIQDYISRLTSIVQQMKTYGEEVTSKQTVSKVMRSLTSKYSQLVTAIEEAKDMETYTFEELKGSLQAFDERQTSMEESNEEKAFQAKGEAPRDNPFGGQGRGRGGFRGGYRGRGRGRHQSNHDRFDYTKNTYKPSIKCYYCNKSGHKEAECWKKHGKPASSETEQRSNYVEQEQLFLAQHNYDQTGAMVWYVDSGCSNHMTGTKGMFQDIVDTKKGVVSLGDGKQLAVEGLRTISVHTDQGKMKSVSNVQYVPQLAHNLLRVGQLVTGGYSVIFEDRRDYVQLRMYIPVIFY